MKVEYGIYLVEGSDLVEVSEEELAKNLEHYRPRLLAEEVIEGALWIRPPGLPALEIMDELWALAQGLCFRAVCVLMNDPASVYVYRCFSSGATLRLSPEWPKVRISGEYIPEVCVNASDLFRVLFGCGGRYLTLLEALGGKAAEFRDHLVPFAHEAEVCLRQLDERIRE